MSVVIDRLVKKQESILGMLFLNMNESDINSRDVRHDWIPELHSEIHLLISSTV